MRGSDYANSFPSGAIEALSGTKSRDYLNLALASFQSCLSIAHGDKVLVGDDSIQLIFLNESFDSGYKVFPHLKNTGLGETTLSV